jgi:hypothetical protein
MVRSKALKIIPHDAQHRGYRKKDSLLYPALCLCGGITVIGAGTFISHFEELSVKKESA